MPELVLAIDQGTTGNTILLLDPGGKVLSRATNEFPQIFPEPGWVEHNPDDIWNGIIKTIAEALTRGRVGGRDIGAIGITNQRETVVVWDAASGRPVHNALVWQDRRTAGRCAQLRAEGLGEDVRRRTGLVIDPYFSGTKIEWLLDKLDPGRTAAGRGQWRAGTIDCYLLHRLTGGTVHATEPSNASRTLLFNINTGDWDDVLLDRFRVPRALLPSVAPTAGVFGVTRGLDVLPDGIPIAGIAGDQQAALFGQACFSPGLSKCTYGTGAFLLVNTGTRRVDSRFGMLTTIAWRLPNRPAEYALEGSAFIAGAAVQWLRDGLGIIGAAAEIEALAASVPDSGGVVFVPALTGLGAPHWRADARGAILGVTRGTTKAHLARATLEGIAFQIAELVQALNADAPAPISELRVDGGAAADDLLMQIQADFAQIPIVRPANLETTAWGAGFLAGLGAGIYRSPDDIAAAWRSERRFRPAIGKRAAAARLKVWRKAVKKA